MKIRVLSVGVIASLLVAGCGKQQTAANADTSTTAPATSGTPAATAAPAAPAAAASSTAATPAATSGAKTIEITANDQMKFSLATMEAKAGEQVTVKLTNQGTLPKEAMGHNWVLLKKGVDVNAFATAAMTAKDTDYIPASMKDSVIANIKVLGPKQTGEVTFKAPEAGEYTFICSFPGHYMLMKGTFTSK